MTNLDVEPLQPQTRTPIPGLPDELTELHLHVGGAVAPHILFSMAHEQGFKLPVADYFEFVDLVTSGRNKVKNLDDYLRILHTWTERIQSSPAAIERSVYEILSKEYRGSKVSTMELRFNPMKRNVGGERDLDQIIHAALRGLDRACLDYNISAGLIFCLAREFDAELNEVIVEKAIRYNNRGIIGIDLAGTESNSLELEEDSVQRYAALFAKARDAGLGTTVHTGETTATNGEGVIAVIRNLKPDRIGHGIRAAYNQEALKLLNGEGVTLEICPTSNLHTRAVSGIKEMKHVVRTFIDNDVKVTINTDGTYLLRTDLRREVELLALNDILTASEVETCFKNATAASFLPEAQSD
jgi:adenosine deaminase